jgi:hypothetical protein
MYRTHLQQQQQFYHQQQQHNILIQQQQQLLLQQQIYQPQVGFGISGSNGQNDHVSIFFFFIKIKQK